MRKKVLLVFFSVLLMLVGLPAVNVQGAVQVSAGSAVVYQPESKTVLFAKNERQRRAMASTTKIMTALLTLEYAAKDDRLITVSAEAAATEGSSMGLKAGDRVLLSQLAAGMLIVSGNDAANAAAQGIAGSVTQFVQLMNQRARQLGMTDTCFETPSGLDGENHYTTAMDMAVLAAAAMENPAFAKIAGSRQYTLEIAQPARSLTVTNHNRLLSMYEGCTGVKTGYTEKAGRCLVSCAVRGGVTLLVVTLDDPDDWNDHRALLDDGFSRIRRVEADEPFAGQLTVVGGAQEEAIAVAAETSPGFYTADADAKLTCTVYLPAFLYAPVKQGDCVGRLVYRLGNQEASVPITAQQEVPLFVKEKSFLQKLQDFLR